MNKHEYHSGDSVVLDPFWFETEFDYQKWGSWMEQHWHWSIYASIVYVITIYCGQNWMASRPPFRLKKLLILWNLALCIFSFVFFIRTFPYMWKEVTTFGVKHAVCNKDQTHHVTLVWNFAFALSKIVEYGDTLFIVARKQKLIFLHWYHHVTVSIYCFAYFSPVDPATRLFGMINGFIHTLMYGYYFFKAMEIKVPRQLSKIITCLQIAQMFIGLFVNLLSLHIKVKEERCDRGYYSILLGLAMYGSYLVLFVHFFKSTYNTSYKRPRTSKLNKKTN